MQLGETLHAAVRREMREETGLEVEVGEVVEVFDRIEPGPDGRPLFHYVVVDYLCRWSAGTLQAGDDAEAAEWVSAEELPRYGVRPHATQVIVRALDGHNQSASASTGPMLP